MKKVSESVRGRFSEYALPLRAQTAPIPPYEMARHRVPVSVVK